MGRKRDGRRGESHSHSTPEVIDLETFCFSGKRPISSIIDLSDEEDEDVKIISFIPKTIPSTKRKRNNIEKGESSNSNNTPFVCEICTDTKTMKDAFYISGCSHVYCSDCVAMYIGSKLEENIVKILCPFPGCKGSLEADFCRSILPAKVFERWGKALCEALFDVSNKFYCPFPDCSALLIDDGTEAVRNSECPDCNRMFCAQCKVPWHEGFKCNKVEKLNADETKKEDVMLMRLAKKKKWMRCPKLCGCGFCYRCGGVCSSYDDSCNCYKISRVFTNLLSYLFN